MRKFFLTFLAVVTALGACAAKPILKDNELEKFDEINSIAKINSLSPKAEAALTNAIKTYDMRYPKRAKKSRMAKMADIISLVSGQIENNAGTTTDMIEGCYLEKCMYNWGSLLYYNRINAALKTKAQRDALTSLYLSSDNLCEKVAEVGAAVAQLDNFGGSLARVNSAAAYSNVAREKYKLMEDIYNVIVTKSMKVSLGADPAGAAPAFESHFCDIIGELPDYMKYIDYNQEEAEAIVNECVAIIDDMPTSLNDYVDRANAFAQVYYGTPKQKDILLSVEASFICELWHTVNTEN